ncbi:phosphate ABC transporter permease subunit PstC [Yinghuangia sp. YIM S09857]|uniref:phosphate ABC transporter permease subunit PstC n=1 Tax=Yinghuangia sp. YIM S09857 TaxID=3436929 RepID=UPI003F535CC2
MTAAVPDAETDTPRRIAVRRTRVDLAYRWTTRLAACAVLALLGAIGLYLLRRGYDALDAAGWSFFTEDEWTPVGGTFGVKGLLVGTVLVALVALLVAVPIALTAALFITEYAPPSTRRVLTSIVDMMAAVPSIVYGLFGFFLLQPQLIPISEWLATHFGFVPIFEVHKLEGVSRYVDGQFASSLFISGVVVSCMVIPICCAVMREVFAQAPAGEKEGALALGATRWGVVRSVVLPFGRGGIIGGVMLGLGRALGETIAVAIVLSFDTGFTVRVLEGHGSTISTLIILKFGEADEFALSALMAAGLALFMMTLMVNVVAGWAISKSRSGGATEA